MPASSLLQYAIDTPPPLRATEGKLRLQGWLAGLVETGVKVRLRLGRDTVFEAESELPRPDVFAAHPELIGAATSGFTVETYISPGFHLGTLEYLVPGQIDWSPFHRFSLVAELAPLFAYLDTAPPEEKTPGSTWNLGGWCFHPQADITSLAAHWGPHQVELSRGIERPDVAAQFPGIPFAKAAGFHGRLSLKPGSGPLRVVAKLADGAVVQTELIPSLEIPDPELTALRRDAWRARASLLRLPPAGATPDVSIIIPIYNQLELTLGCLESIVRHAGRASFEVIVIDDKSDPAVTANLALIKNLRLYVNEVNRGFVLNCNLGAREARGRYVLFLNNDTEVTPGWLEAMLDVFQQRSKVGAVGAKLIYPDGRLQEAGGLIWEDGSGVNFGKWCDPDRPEYNYLRQVDYCSGACLLVPRDLFLELGGFDTRYCPAYYEDTDLAFAIRAAGQKVYYQPAARIIHFEGASSGTDVRTGVKRHQVINREKFTEKWKETLQHHGSDASLQEVARDRFAAGRVLVLDACALTPDADSGSLRMFNLLLMLARREAKVTFAAENLQAYEPFTTQLRLAGVEHINTPHVFDLTQYLETNAYVFDVIVLSRKHVAKRFIDIVRRAAPHACIVFDTVDLMFLRLQRQAVHEQSAALQEEAAHSREAELALCAKADLVFVVSPVEAELLAQDVPPSKIALISNIHSTYPAKAVFDTRRGLLFVGGYQHPPNVDAVDFLLDEVMPLVRHRLPDLEVHIVGSNMPARWQAHAGRNTHLHGFVADLNPLYEQVRLAVAPLRYGAGVKGKVNQAMAHGVPVVATTMATEGMHLKHGRDVLVADAAAEFAAEIVRIHEERSLWEAIAAGGLENIERHFSFAAVERELADTLARHLPSPTAGLKPLPRRPAPIYTPGMVLTFGRSGTARPYLREGWGEPEETSCWMIGHRAGIGMELDPVAVPSRIRIIVYPYLCPPALGRQSLTLAVNGTPLSPQEISVTHAEATELSWELPSDLLRRSRILSLILSSPNAIAPKTLDASADERKLSFAFLSLLVQ